jgi:hypothetical protein
MTETKKKEKLNWSKKPQAAPELAAEFAQRANGTWVYKLDDGRREDGFDSLPAAVAAAKHKAAKPVVPRLPRVVGDDKAIPLEQLTEDQLGQRIASNKAERRGLEDEIKRRKEEATTKLAALEKALS